MKSKGQSVSYRSGDRVIVTGDSRWLEQSGVITRRRSSGKYLYEVLLDNGSRFWFAEYELRKEEE